MKKNMNRKGFTLIEMMIVIAIIAVLVAVIVPTVTGSTDKAAAATNAANLRGVEGEIVSMMLLEPDAFGDHSDEQAKIDGERDWRENRNDELQEAKDNLAAAKEKLEEARDPKKVATNLKAEAQEDLTAAQTKKSNAEAVCRNEHCRIVVHFCGTANVAVLVEAELEIGTANTTISMAQAVIDGKTSEAFNTIYNMGVSAAESVVQDFQKIYDNLDKSNQDALDDLAAQEQALYELKAVNGVITLDNGTTIQAPVSKKVNKDAVNVDKDVEMVVYVNTTTYEAYAYYKGDKMYQSSDFAAVAGNED